jgi:hypothetical protein
VKRRPPVHILTLAQRAPSKRGRFDPVNSLREAHGKLREAHGKLREAQ